MKISDVCTWGKIQVRGGLFVSWQIVDVPAWRHREFAAHEQIGRAEVWGITIAPLGLGLPPEWASFAEARQAVGAMVEIARLRNGWHLITQDDLTSDLIGRMKAICKRHRAAVTKGMAAMTADADLDVSGLPFTRLNGYATPSEILNVS